MLTYHGNMVATVLCMCKRALGNGKCQLSPWTALSKRRLLYDSPSCENRNSKTLITVIKQVDNTNSTSFTLNNISINSLCAWVYVLIYSLCFCRACQSTSFPRARPWPAACPGITAAAAWASAAWEWAAPAWATAGQCVRIISWMIFSPLMRLSDSVTYCLFSRFQRYYTELCKIIPACLTIPAPSAAKQLYQPCIAQSANFIKFWLKSQNLAGTFLHHSVTFFP